MSIIVQVFCLVCRQLKREEQLSLQRLLVGTTPESVFGLCTACEAAWYVCAPMLELGEPEGGRWCLYCKWRDNDKSALVASLCWKYYDTRLVDSVAPYAPYDCGYVCSSCVGTRFADAAKAARDVLKL